MATVGIRKNIARYSKNALCRGLNKVHSYKKDIKLNYLKYQA